MSLKYSFRCRECGRLETSEQVCEADHPHACRVCGGGVSFNPRTGIKTLNKDNWDVLADMTDAALSKIGLTRNDVEKHTPLPATNSGPPKNISVHAADGIKISEKVS